MSTAQQIRLTEHARQRRRMLLWRVAAGVMLLIAVLLAAAQISEINYQDTLATALAQTATAIGSTPAATTAPESGSGG
jgi:hypothetical protein